jgi:transposase
MMGRLNRDQGQFFYSFRLDEAVPDDHPVRGIASVLDLSWVHVELAPFYPKIGRPSIDPELMIRMLIIGYVFAIRSERALCRDVQVNLAYRWFCGLSIEDKVPDHSAFSRARHERFRESDMFRRVFERVVEACIAAGLVSGEGFAVDASLIVADANKQRSVPGTQWKKTCAPDAASRAMREYLATLDDAAFGAASEVTPKFVSPADPAAQWTGAMRGPAFFAYADNYLIDVKFGIIVDVEASRAIRQAEVGAAKTMIEGTQQRFDLKPTYLAADTAYGSAETLNWLVNDKKIEPHIQVIDKSRREDGTFARADFILMRSATSMSARTTRCCTRLEPCTTAMHFAIAPPSPTAMSARSKCGVVPALRCDIYPAISMKAPEMSLARWPRPTLSSNRAAAASALRCCLPILNAFCALVGFGCEAHAVRKMSSRSQPSRRTCDGLQGL